MRRLSTVLSAVVLLSCLVGEGSAQPSGACAPAPRIGCVHTEQVELRVRPSTGQIDWRWYGDAADASGDFALCLYDGARTTQTEAEAPAAGVDSLVLGVTPSSVDGDGGRLTARGVADMGPLDTVDGDRFISQLQGDNVCYGRSMAIAFANGPPFPESGAGVMNAERGKRLLDELAAEHAAAQDGDALSMMRWISAVAATQIQDRVARSPSAAVDHGSIFGALHIAGWFGGIWFVRDGFQRPAPESVDPAGAEGALRLYAEGRDAALEASEQDLFRRRRRIEAGGVS